LFDGGSGGGSPSCEGGLSDDEDASNGEEATVMMSLLTCAPTLPPPCAPIEVQPQLYRLLHLLRHNVLISYDLI
jgi:hypothetical protein